MTFLEETIKVIAQYRWESLSEIHNEEIEDE